MKIKDDIKLGLTTGSVNSCCDIWELEETDFDKAIQILIKFNKKSAIREYQLLKEEFNYGEPEWYDVDTDRFIRNLVQCATKRTSEVEARRIRKEIQNTFNQSHMNSLEKFIRKIADVYSSREHNINQLNYHKKALEIADAKVAVLNDWFDAEKFEGDVLETFSADKQEEVRSILQEIGEAHNEEEVESTRYR